MLCQTFEVLDGGGEQEFVAGTGEPAEPQAGEGEDVFDLAEERFDLLALGSCDPVGRALHHGAGMIARRLFNVPWHAP